MKVGVFQFSSCRDIKKNFETIKSAVHLSAKENVRLVVFQECAACGYPPIETDCIDNINFDIIHDEIQHIASLAKKYNMYIAIGTIRKESDKYYNSIQMIDFQGNFLSAYDKRALWGWDIGNFEKGNNLGIYEIDNIKIGFRICFEIRFPEYFRELFVRDVALCFVSFCDVADEDSPERYNLIKSHIATRAVENVMTVISVNSTSKFQTAPTAVIDHNGKIVYESPKGQEYLLVYEYEPPKTTFGMEGRITHSKELISAKAMPLFEYINTNSNKQPPYI